MRLDPATLGDGRLAFLTRNRLQRFDFGPDLAAQLSVSGSRSMLTGRMPVVVAVSKTFCWYSVERPNAATSPSARR